MPLCKSILVFYTNPSTPVRKAILLRGRGGVNNKTIPKTETEKAEESTLRQRRQGVLNNACAQWHLSTETRGERR